MQGENAMPGKTYRMLKKQEKVAAYVRKQRDGNHNRRETGKEGKNEILQQKNNQIGNG